MSTVLALGDQYIYKSEVSLTGTTVDSNNPIFVISGMQETSKPDDVLMEHIRPDAAWGSNYVLFVPFVESVVHVAAYGK